MYNITGKEINGIVSKEKTIQINNTTKSTPTGVPRTTLIIRRIIEPIYGSNVFILSMLLFNNKLHHENNKRY